MVHHIGDELVAAQQLQRSNELHRALERDEFETRFQPIVELGTGAMIGLASRPCWRHPERGLLLPDQFIDDAEESGLAATLADRLLYDSCHQGAAWAVERARNHQGDDRLNIAVTMLAQQLADPGFPDTLAGQLESSGFDADHLWLVITEGILAGDHQVAPQTAERIRSLGVHVAIDGFGTDPSALRRLKEFPVELVKIDASAVARSTSDAVDDAVVHSMVVLGSSLGLLVVADGVSHADQAAKLVSFGCRMAQGPLFGMPRSIAEIGGFPSDDLAGWQRAAALAPA
jgi:EAL domain-containing protein (putative c-di-GMP-specific phosphodiesterase class I)